MSKTREEVVADGFRFYCMACSRVFRELPTEHYEDGHGGRQLAMCRCGCDLFANLGDDSQARLEAGR